MVFRGRKALLGSCEEIEEINLTGPVKFEDSGEGGKLGPIKIVADQRVGGIANGRKVVSAGMT